ncbi:MAG TPA: extracellular solute-binding protein [Candidatus Binatia bacterium]|jgi:ABC-type Fe3+ transport system substrate-binding protein|nr:extracellular solute-binding protein [Candidatus Binatia bacterium]
MQVVGKSEIVATILSVLSVLSVILARSVFGAAAPANFEQEWSKLIAAAKQEGTLAIASGGAPSRQYRPVTDAFTKKFGVNIEVSTGNATDTVNRLLAERKGGKYTVDVALISSRESNQRLLPSGSLVPLTPLLMHPEVVDMSGWYRGRHWYADKASSYVLIYHVSKEDQYESWYNTEKVKDADIATIKRQTDYFDPRWKGKIAGQGMGDPSGIRQMIDSYFEPDRGQEWIRTYLLNAGVTFSDDRRILETWLVGGRFPFYAVATGSEELIALAKKGLPIKQVFFPKQLGVIRAGGSGCCISAFANAPHPNAAKLFINWFLSREGQTMTHTMIPNLDRSSLRNDIPTGEVVPEQRRAAGVEYAFPDADPKFGARQEEAQKWVLKLWESRQK